MSKSEVATLIITAAGVIFAGYQVYYLNSYNKNKDTMLEMSDWTKKTEIRIDIFDLIKYSEKWQTSYRDHCFWHYTILSSETLHSREDFSFYPLNKFSSCNITPKKINPHFGSLYNMLTELFNYYETLSTGYLINQFNEEIFKKQFKEYLTYDKKVLNWLDDYGWEKKYPSYFTLLDRWRESETTLEKQFLPTYWGGINFPTLQKQNKTND